MDDEWILQLFFHEESVHITKEIFHFWYGEAKLDGDFNCDFTNLLIIQIIFGAR